MMWLATAQPFRWDTRWKRASTSRRVIVSRGRDSQSPRQYPHLPAIERFGAALAVGVRRQVLLERLPEVRHAATLGPLLSGILAPGDASQQLLGEAARLLGGQMAAAADGDAPVARLPAAASRCGS